MKTLARTPPKGDPHGHYRDEYTPNNSVNNGFIENL